jgi:hypothetical protein
MSKTINFSSTITLPDGTYVNCTIVVPKRAATPDVMEMCEVAGIGANRAADVIRRSIARRSEQVPF